MSPMVYGEAVKFSETVVAGANNSFAGQTMDAFAHFSLEMTGGRLVLTDIQGMEKTVTTAFIQCVDIIGPVSNRHIYR